MDKRLIILILFIIGVFAGLTALSSAENIKTIPINDTNITEDGEYCTLNEVAASYEQMYKENTDLIKKISILADKIESYRNDEEAIKLALLDAHKMAENISKSASDKAEALVADAENKSKILLDGANRQTAQMIEEAREQAKNIVDNAREACDALTAKAQKDADDKLRIGIDQFSVCCLEEDLDEISRKYNIVESFKYNESKNCMSFLLPILSFLSIRYYYFVNNLRS